MMRDRATMNLAGHRDRRLSENYFEPCTPVIAGSQVQTPLKSWIFFQASLRNCINCVDCDDHFLHFQFISTVHIWFISYIINNKKYHTCNFLEKDVDLRMASGWDEVKADMYAGIIIRVQWSPYLQFLL